MNGSQRSRTRILKMLSPSSALVLHFIYILSNLYLLDFNLFIWAGILFISKKEISHDGEKMRHQKVQKSYSNLNPKIV